MKNSELKKVKGMRERLARAIEYYDLRSQERTIRRMKSEGIPLSDMGREVVLRVSLERILLTPGTGKMVRDIAREALRFAYSPEKKHAP